MHYKKVAVMLERHRAAECNVRIRVKNPRAAFTMIGKVNGEPRYIKYRGCFCIPIKLGKKKLWLRCPDIARIERV